MAGFLNWGGRIALYFLFRSALYLLVPDWRAEIRIVLYAVLALWLYNEFPALNRAVRRWLGVEPDESDDEDSWAELKDFAFLVVGVLVIQVVSALGQRFVERNLDPEHFVAVIGFLQIAGFLLTAGLFVRYGWALLRGKRFIKGEDADKKQAAEDTVEEQA